MLYEGDSILLFFKGVEEEDWAYGVLKVHVLHQHFHATFALIVALNIDRSQTPPYNIW